MSRQPSPSPNHPSHLHNSMYQQQNMPTSSSAKQSRPKNYPTGITAGAEDSKYQTKYRELKKKVREIEFDNDKLYLKLLLAKKNIRRMNLERAILYERLAQVPPTPGRHPQDLPPETDPIFNAQPPPQPTQPDHAAREPDSNDPLLTEYLQAHPNARLVCGVDGRVVAIEDTPPVDSRGRPLSGPPPPHGIPLVQGFRHGSGPGFDPTRQLPALPPHASFATPLDQFPEPPTSNTRAEHHTPNVWPADGQQAQQSQPQQQHHHHRSHSNSSSHHNHHHSHGPPSVHGDLDQQDRDRDRDRDRDNRDRDRGGDSLPPVHSLRGRRTSISSDAPSESSRRRHDLHDITIPRDLGHPHPHIHVSPPEHGSSSPSLVSPTSSRTGGGGERSRIHNHQRVGPGANIMRERDPEVERELRRQREVEKERDRERDREMAAYRHQLALEDPDIVPSLRGGPGVSWSNTRASEEAGLIGPGIGHHDRSRSDTPGSASGNDPSRGPSTPSYERERERERGGGRSFAPRISNILGLDQDSLYDHRDERGGGPSFPRRLPSESAVGLSSGGPSGDILESRKRSRNDMEVDDDRGNEILPSSRDAVAHSAGPGGLLSNAGGLAEDGLIPSLEGRGSKRPHHHDDRDSTPGRGSVGRDEKPMDQDD